MHVSPSDVLAIPTHPSSYACIDLVNSRFTDYLGRGVHDRLPMQPWQTWFLRRHGLRVGRGERMPLQEMRRFRDELRAVLDKWSAGHRLTAADLRRMNHAIAAAEVRRRVVLDGGVPELHFEPSTHDWSWVMASVASSAVELMASSPPERVKTCANPDCSWMFHDETLNASRRFCSGQPCGNLIRIREFRDRQRRGRT